MVQRRQKQTRTRQGQAIIESTCGLIVFLMVAIGLALGLLDVYAIMVNSQKVKLAADAAAKVANDGRFWLGTYRNDFDANASRQRAEATANYVLHAQGLPNCELLVFEPGLPVQENGSYFVCSHVRIKVPGLRLPFIAAGIPGVIDLTCDSYNAESSFTPYAAMVVGFANIGETDPYGRPVSTQQLTRRIQVPVIGYGNQDANGGLSSSPVGGSGSAVPGGRYVGTECRVYGALSSDTLTVHDVSSGTDVTSSVPW
jgi:hypothetical protein